MHGCPEDILKCIPIHTHYASNVLRIVNTLAKYTQLFSLYYPHLLCFNSSLLFKRTAYDLIKNFDKRQFLSPATGYR